MQVKKSLFESPAIVKVVHVAYENDILVGSVVKGGKTEVQTTGQQVKSYDFSDTSFNQDWETGSI
jgi:hypothetical protein